MRKLSSASPNSETLNQLAVLIYKLAKIAKNSWVYSALSVYNPCVETLGLLASRQTGNIGQIPCLVSLNFTLSDGHLNTFALWRHQTFDHKAYGNWISLIILLKLITDVTNELRATKPFARMKVGPIKGGRITSVACRADFVKDRHFESRKAIYDIAKSYLPKVEN